MSSLPNQPPAGTLSGEVMTIDSNRAADTASARTSSSVAPRRSPRFYRAHIRRICGDQRPPLARLRHLRLAIWPHQALGAVR